MALTVRVEPPDNYNTAKAERWMSEMAAKGLFFDHSATFTLVSFLPLAFFEKGTPEHRKYHLEPNERAFSEATEEQKQIFRDNGWEYAGEARRNYAVYYTRYESDGELYTDAYTSAGLLSKLRKRYTLLFIGFALLAVLFAIGKGVLNWITFALCAAEAMLFGIRVLKQTEAEKMVRDGRMSLDDTKSMPEKKLMGITDILFVAAIIVISIVNILR